MLNTLDSDSKARATRLESRSSQSNSINGVMDLRFPLDYICVKTGVLCPRCQKLIDSGEVEVFEVDIMRVLIDLENDDELKDLVKSLTYIKSYKVSDTIVVLVDLKEKFVHPSILQRIARAIGERLRARVRVINSASKDLRSVASQLVFPARILGINTVWLPDGSTFYVVRIPRNEARYIPIPLSTVERILSSITGIDVQIRAE